MEDSVIARQRNSESIKIEEIKSRIWSVCMGRAGYVPGGGGGKSEARVKSVLEF